MNRAPSHPLAIALILAGLLAATPARAQYIEGFLEALRGDGPVGDDVRRSLGCMAGATITGVTALLYSQTQFVVVETAVAGAAPYFAVPLFVATLVTGCSLGQSLAPGIDWLRAEASRIAERAKSTR